MLFSRVFQIKKVYKRWEFILLGIRFIFEAGGEGRGLVLSRVITFEDSQLLLCATGVSMPVYLQYVDRQIKAAELDVEDLHDHSAIDLQAASPFVIISVGHIGILLADVS